MKTFVNILDHDTDALERLLERCAASKARYRRRLPDLDLTGRVLATFFEKPSTRTRFGFEAAAASMGGYVITSEMIGGARLGEREPVKDVARVAGRYCDLIAVRTFAHETMEGFAQWAGKPVVNLLSDYSHPTQAMADMITIREHLGTEKGKTLVFVGDGNNVARSLAAACGRLGMRMRLACPEGFGLDAAFRERLEAECPDFDFAETHDPAAAAAEA
ncbi:MAG: ornithine carbamoyltransferase, partial [Planctomycetota bacterium]